MGSQVVRRDGHPQDPKNVVCPTAGPVLTPVFVARNCWREKENVRRCGVSPEGVGRQDND